MPKIKINTFGEGIEIRQLHLDPDTYQKWNAIAARKNRLLADLLLDPFFYYQLKDSRFKEMTDIDSVLVSGMLNTTKSHIEIWFDRRKVQKIQSHEIFNEIVLFPLFKLATSQSFVANDLEKGIYVVQKTIGLIRSEQLQISEQKLNMDDFIFTIAEWEKTKFVTEIKYKNQTLNPVKSDTSIIYQTAFEIQ
ncbi:hypothetical protein FFWV33_15975 [Flavobacterium faecale]|uniref:Uncharacterized protein n=1 Tax=Flavobacterium faecale TaxID=1355330 RepID=A0A2S1LGQ2_9FLAO|nr:hypothetical protein [Flavobacterium faecale]AWG22917.1 hypothetical protein FFWV33_15975 [Flavobacterium faecale]